MTSSWTDKGRYNQRSVGNLMYCSSFDIIIFILYYSSVRTHHGIRRTKEMKRFLYYSLYAWGFPFVLVKMNSLINYWNIFDLEFIFPFRPYLPSWLIFTTFCRKVWSRTSEQPNAGLRVCWNFFFLSLLLNSKFTLHLSFTIATHSFKLVELSYLNF